MIHFEQHHIQLAYPLLLAKATKGVLVCGYFNIATFEATGEAAVLVSGVNNFDEMLDAKVVTFTTAAAKLGVTADDTGRSALEKFQ